MKELDYLTQKIKYEQDYLLQDYFKIALKDRKWKSQYELIVEEGVKNKYKKNKYKAAFINIREYGIDKIDIESFDVTLSAAFYEDINNEKFDLSDIYYPNVASTIRFIAMDRNYLSHLNGNEPLEDVITLLYGSLNSIKYLLDAISWTDFDKDEVTAYIRKYIDRKTALAIEIDECYELCKKEKISEETERRLIREHKYTKDVGLWLLNQMSTTRSARGLEGDELWNETLRFYKIASEEGLYAATENLIIIYENGFHFEKDLEKVEQLKKLAAEQKRDYDEKMGIKHNRLKKDQEISKKCGDDHI